MAAQVLIPRNPIANRDWDKLGTNRLRALL